LVRMMELWLLVIWAFRVGKLKQNSESITAQCLCRIWEKLNMVYQCGSRREFRRIVYQKFFRVKVEDSPITCTRRKSHRFIIFILLILQFYKCAVAFTRRFLPKEFTNKTRLYKNVGNAHDFFKTSNWE